MLGASGWQTFWRVTLPNIKWGAALRRDPVQRPRDGRVRRGVGRVRATSAGRPTRCRCTSRFSTTSTNFAAAFAVASLLALLALVTLALKSLVEWNDGSDCARHADARDQP